MYLKRLLDIMNVNDSTPINFIIKYMIFANCNLVIQFKTIFKIVITVNCNIL